MALRVTRSCPSCGAVFESGLDRRGIGIPFVECEECGEIIALNHITEWELKSFWQKCAFILITIWTAVLYACGAVVIGCAVEQLATETIIWMNTASHVLAIYSIGLLVTIPIGFVLLGKDIRQSKTRMASPKYRALLISAGLLKD
jgi:choline-glycine betaine transporter